MQTRTFPLGSGSPTLHLHLCSALLYTSWLAACRHFWLSSLPLLWHRWFFRFKQSLCHNRGLCLGPCRLILVADPLKQAVHSEPDSNSEPHGLTKRLEEIRLDRDHDVPTITVIPPTNPPAAHAAQPQQPHNLAPLIVTNNGPQGPAPVPLAPAAP